MSQAKAAKINLGDQTSHKWGVMILLKANLRVGEVYRPQGTLAARVVLLSAFVEAVEVEPLWVLCIYAPVNNGAQAGFFSDLSTLWEEHKLNGQKVILMGDLNARIQI